MVLCAVTSETVATMTWTELRERVTRLEAEVALRSTESRDSSARLERDLNRAARREADLTRQLQTVQRKLKRTERLLLKPGQYAICIKTSKILMFLTMQALNPLLLAVAVDIGYTW